MLNMAVDDHKVTLQTQ